MPPQLGAPLAQFHLPPVLYKETGSPLFLFLWSNFARLFPKMCFWEMMNQNPLSRNVPQSSKHELEILLSSRISKFSTRSPIPPPSPQSPSTPQDGQLWISGCTMDALCIGRHPDLELLEDERNCFEVYESLVLGRKEICGAFDYQTWLAGKCPRLIAGKIVYKLGTIRC